MYRCEDFHVLSGSKRKNAGKQRGNKEALEEGIELNCGWGPKEVLEEDGHVSGVVFKKCTRVFDAQGRFSPEYE